MEGHFLLFYYEMGSSEGCKGSEESEIRNGKKKSEKSIKNVARERARLSEKHWHFGSNLERQQCDTWYDWLASGLGKKPFPRAKLEWQMNKSAH